MQPKISRLGMPAAVTKGVKLLCIAELQSCLLRYPGAKAAFKCTVLTRCKRAEWQTLRRAWSLVLVANREHDRLVINHGNYCSIEANGYTSRL
jgi:hypothetical protein